MEFSHYEEVPQEESERGKTKSVSARSAKTSHMQDKSKFFQT
jgi:hypothetical protein